MSTSKNIKIEAANKVHDRLKTAQTVVFAKYHGVTANNMSKIRKLAREHDVYLHIVKNTLVKVAVMDTPFQELKDHMVGPLIYGVSDDPISAAKIINALVKENEVAKIVAGMYNNKILSPEEITALATLPSREQLLSQLVGILQQLIARFVRVIALIAATKEESPKIAEKEESAN